MAKVKYVFSFICDLKKTFIHSLTKTPNNHNNDFSRENITIRKLQCYVKLKFNFNFRAKQAAKKAKEPKWDIRWRLNVARVGRIATLLW